MAAAKARHWVLPDGRWMRTVRTRRGLASSTSSTVPSSSVSFVPGPGMVPAWAEHNPPTVDQPWPSSSSSPERTGSCEGSALRQM